MNTWPDASGVASFSKAIDAFLALSTIYLDGAERLSLNTLVVTRATLDECAAAARKIAESPEPGEVPALAIALGQSMLARGAAYGRESLETVSAAGFETTRVLSEHLASPTLQLPASDEWKKALETLTSSFRNFSATRVASFANSTDTGWPFALKYAD